MYHPEALEPIISFLRDIKLNVEFGEKAHGGFLPGINIHAGVIYIDPQTLAGSGDVLHEAGHIIVVPRRYWSRLHTDLQINIETLLAEETLPDGSPDPVLTRAAGKGEVMAQAWSYAVALHLGIDPKCIFFPGAYKQAAYDDLHPMQQCIESGTHYGPLNLCQAGMTGPSGVFSVMHDNGLPPFPQMTRWTLD